MPILDFADSVELQTAELQIIEVAGHELTSRSGDQQ